MEVKSRRYYIFLVVQRSDEKGIRFSRSTMQGASHLAHPEVKWEHMQLRRLVPVLLERSPWVVFCIALNGCQSNKGNTRPSIEFTQVPPATQNGRGRVDTGRVRNARPSQQIVIYAHTGQWWVQTNHLTSDHNGGR